MSNDNKPFITINISKPKWLTKRLAGSVFIFLCVIGVAFGGYFIGQQSIDQETIIEEYLASEPTTMIKGRLAGYAVNLVGNSTISNNWIAFCDAIIQDCADILQGNLTNE